MSASMALAAMRRMGSSGLMGGSAYICAAGSLLKMAAVTDSTILSVCTWFWMACSVCVKDASGDGDSLCAGVPGDSFMAS
ncbi:jg24061 [Pararge aegeria aegeria]|uniref:Jg24061 protein n=1 Tax=Pararge aegeria aegeria TaxID=348720 RepID=A0A8S4S1U0_9NEOP|nr:jg24061 [Pararge aegeria aegeria]